VWAERKIFDCYTDDTYSDHKAFRTIIRSRPARSDSSTHPHSDLISYCSGPVQPQTEHVGTSTLVFCVVTPRFLVDSEQCFGNISFLLPTSKALHPANCNLDTPGLTVLAMHLDHEDQPVNLVLGNNRHLLHLTKHTNTLCGNAVLLWSGKQKHRRKPEGYTCLSDMLFPRPRTHACTGLLLTDDLSLLLLSVNTQNTPLLSNTHVNIF
jgi:hypothetical protein